MITKVHNRPGSTISEQQHGHVRSLHTGDNGGTSCASVPTKAWVQSVQPFGIVVQGLRRLTVAQAFGDAFDLTTRVDEQHERDLLIPDVPPNPAGDDRVFFSGSAAW